MVAEGEATHAVIKCLMSEPKLSSFFAAREPLLGPHAVADEPMPTVAQLQNILHPTCLPWEPSGAPSQYTASGRLLAESLPEVHAPKVLLRETPDYYTNELAAELIEYFASWNWRGLLPTSGNSKSLPLLTRLDGGMKAWSVGKVDPNAARQGGIGGTGGGSDSVGDGGSSAGPRGAKGAAAGEVKAANTGGASMTGVPTASLASSLVEDLWAGHANAELARMSATHIQVCSC